jgi:hypothetical protein
MWNLYLQLLVNGIPTCRLDEVFVGTARPYYSSICYSLMLVPVYT